MCCCLLGCRLNSCTALIASTSQLSVSAFVCRTTRACVRLPHHPQTSEAGLALLSPPARLARLDLQGLVGAAAAAAWRNPTGTLGAPPPFAAAAPAGGGPGATRRLERAALRQLRSDARIEAAAAGSADAALLWLELEGCGGGAVVSTAAGVNALAKGGGAAAAAAGDGACDTAPLACGSVRAGLAYLDAPLLLERGQEVTLRLRPGQEGHSLCAAAELAPRGGSPLQRRAPAPTVGADQTRAGASAGSGGGLAARPVVGAGAAASLGPAGWPRHALLAPWHWPMLADGARNGAFDAAIRCAAGCHVRMALHGCFSPRVAVACACRCAAGRSRNRVMLW